MDTSHAFASLIKLHKERQLDDVDLGTIFVNIVMLQPSREQAVSATRVQLFSGSRLGDAIGDLPDVVATLAKVLRDEGVERYQEVVNQIRSQTVAAPDYERVFFSALRLAELYRTGKINDGPVREACRVAERAVSEKDARARAVGYIQQRGLTVSGYTDAVVALYKVLDVEHDFVFNKLVTHIMRLVFSDYAGKHHWEVGEVIYRPDLWKWGKLTLDLPTSVAHDWVLKVAPDAKICQGFVARDALKPGGYGWFDKVAVVVDTSESGAIAIYRSDGKYWLLWTDYRGGGR